MSGFKRWAAAAAVAVGFAGTAAAADPVRGTGFFGGFFPGGGWNPYPFPNPGPFPPRPVPFPPRVDFDFVVVYKTGFGPSRVYGRFENFRTAQAAAFRLEAFGYPTKIVPVRDFNNGFRW
jgi:hypothetical protein